MPTPISLALCSLFLFMIMDLIIGLAAVQQGELSLYRVSAEIVVALLIMMGTVKSNRLAWQAGRLLGMIGAVFFGFLTVRLLIFPQFNLGLGDRPVELTALAVQTVCLAAIPVAFATHAARSHFELVCPMCGESSATTGDLFFSSVHCKSCNAKF